MKLPSLHSLGLVICLVLHTAVAQESTRPAIDLSGEWEFKLDPLDVGRGQRWHEETVSYERRIQVPGAWNAFGVADDSEQQLSAYEAQRLEEQKPLNQLGTLGVQRESDRLFSVYPGPGWYRKEATIPADWRGKTPWLVFGGVHREAEIRVNGQPAGAHHSYLTPFRIDLSPHAQAGEAITIAVRVDARRRKEVDPLMGCLDTLDFLYVTWGGIHRPVTLEATETTRIGEVFVAPRLSDETAEIRVTVEGPKTGNLIFNAGIVDASGTAIVSVTEPIASDASEAVLAARIPNPKLWSPKTPHLYTVRIRPLSGGRELDARPVRFGMREFKVAGGQFLLNGKPIFLRGYGDDCIFPNTICPPSDKGEFRRRLAVARDYGFNYVRHHSWTPPEEFRRFNAPTVLLLDAPRRNWRSGETAEGTPRRGADRQGNEVIRNGETVALLQCGQVHDRRPTAAEWRDARQDLVQAGIDSGPLYRLFRQNRVLTQERQDDLLNLLELIAHRLAHADA